MDIYRRVADHCGAIRSSDILIYIYKKLFEYTINIANKCLPSGTIIYTRCMCEHMPADSLYSEPSGERYCLHT